MKTLSVTDISDEDAFFYVGELRMVQFYRRALSNGWVQNDTIADFCATTIRLAVENLIMRNVISCSTDIIETRFLYFFKIRETVDYVSFDARRIKEQNVGYLESRLLELVSKRDGFTLADHLNSLFHQILPDREYARPGMEIINSIIRNNALDMWDYFNKKTWLLHDLADLTIDEQQEEKMVVELNTIVRPIIVERNRNPAFKLVSQRVYDEVYEQISRRQNEAD
jgi:hypothetical protein